MDYDVIKNNNTYFSGSFYLDCDKNITSPDERLTTPVFVMLSCVAGASIISCDRVCKAVIPKIVQSFQDHSQVCAASMCALDNDCSLGKSNTMVHGNPNLFLD